jgi:hypothetical protein
MSRVLNWTDVLNQEFDYVVLTKGNRLQVLVRPTRQQLRRRGKRNWSLVAALSKAQSNNGPEQSVDSLRDLVLQTLLELTANEPAPPKKKAKQVAKKKAQV